jgi:hypothetical protein
VASRFGVVTHGDLGVSGSLSSSILEVTTDVWREALVLIRSPSEPSDDMGVTVLPAGLFRESKPLWVLTRRTSSLWENTVLVRLGGREDIHSSSLGGQLIESDGDKDASRDID